MTITDEDEEQILSAQKIIGGLRFVAFTEFIQRWMDVCEIQRELSDIAHATAAWVEAALDGSEASDD